MSDESTPGQRVAQALQRMDRFGALLRAELERRFGVEYVARLYEEIDKRSREYEERKQKSAQDE